MTIDCSNKSNKESIDAIKGILKQKGDLKEKSLRESRSKITHNLNSILYENKKRKIVENLERLFEYKMQGVYISDFLDKNTPGQENISMIGQATIDLTSSLLDEIKSLLQGDLTRIKNTPSEASENLGLTPPDIETAKAHINTSDLSNVEFAWRNDAGVINTFNPMTGEIEILSGISSGERVRTEHFVFIATPASDSRQYAKGVYFINKEGVAATVNDAVNFPRDHLFVPFILRKHKPANATGNTKVQEMLQGIAIQLAVMNGFTSPQDLENAIKDFVRSSDPSLKTLSNLNGNKISVTELNEDSLEYYAPLAVKTGMAFVKKFPGLPKDIGMFHPDMKGCPLETVISIGSTYKGRIPKDCWNPTDILITNMASSFIKETLKSVENNLTPTSERLSEINEILKKWVLNGSSGNDIFIPLSLKLNASEGRESVVEGINLEETEKDYRVTDHYVRRSRTGNSIDISARISGFPYKFCIRTNGSGVVIEGQHLSNSQYSNGSDKAIDDLSEEGKLVSQADIEARKIDIKTNTSSFLGKSKAVLFSGMSNEEFQTKKAGVSFDMKSRKDYKEGSLPWRLVEEADKILRMKDTDVDSKGESLKHDSSKAIPVAELAKDLAALIVLMGWTTDKALVYLLTSAQKENYGQFNKFAPLYKIS